MTHSSITGQAEGNSDGSLKEMVVKRLTDAMEHDGEADPRPVVDEALAMAEAFPLKWTPEQKTAAQAHIDALVEPHRTIFAQFMNGARARQIACSTGLTHKHVLKTIAKIYSALRHI